MHYTKSYLRLCILICTGLLAACTTTPYTRHKSPNISGQIYVDQQAAENISVYLSAKASDTACHAVAQKTLTDNTGSFHFSSIKEEMSYTPLMTYYLDEWVVCADIRGQRTRLYSGNRYGMGSVSERISIECNFDPGLNADQACRQ